MDDMKRYQNDQEKITIMMWKAVSDTEKATHKLSIQATRAKIDATAARLAELSILGQGSALSSLHSRNAARLRALCTSNKGVYVKLGQHLAQLDHVLPAEYIQGKQRLNGNCLQPHHSVRI